MFATNMPSGGVAQVGHGQFSVLVATTCPSMVMAPEADIHLRPPALGARQIILVDDDVPRAPPVHVVALQAVFGP